MKLNKVYLFLLIISLFSNVSLASHLKFDFQENVIKQYGLKKIFLFKTHDHRCTENTVVFDSISLNKDFNEYSYSLTNYNPLKLEIQLYPLDQTKRYFIGKYDELEFKINNSEKAYPDISYQDMRGFKTLNDIYNEFVNYKEIKEYSDLTDEYVDLSKILNLIEKRFDDQEKIIDSLLNANEIENIVFWKYLHNKNAYDKKQLILSNAASSLKKERNVDQADSIIKYHFNNIDYEKYKYYECYRFLDVIKYSIINYEKYVKSNEIDDIKERLTSYKDHLSDKILSKLIIHDIYRFIAFNIEFE